MQRLCSRQLATFPVVLYIYLHVQHTINMREQLKPMVIGAPSFTASDEVLDWMEMPRKHMSVAADNVLTFNILVVLCIIIAFVFRVLVSGFINPSSAGPVCIRIRTWPSLCLLTNRNEICWAIRRHNAGRRVRYISFKVGLGV